MIDISKLQTYLCHKTVHAAEIRIVGNYAQTAEGLARRVTLDSGETLECPADMFARYTPVPGDFYVVYDEGKYASFSPREVFLDGYKSIDNRSFADIKHSLRLPGVQVGPTETKEE